SCILSWKSAARRWGREISPGSSGPGASGRSPLLPRLCEHVTSEDKTTQKQAEKRSLGVLNQHFPPVSNAVLQSAVAFTQSEPVAQTRLDRTRPGRRHLRHRTEHGLIASKPGQTSTPHPPRYWCPR